MDKDKVNEMIWFREWAQRLDNKSFDHNSEAPRGKPRGICAELRRSQPGVARWAMPGRLAIHPPRGKPRGTLAKASRKLFRQCGLG
ncbi:MAG: hypothetical protein Q7J98_01465 [Kiritimatiellia bacterium]|nr:hypothetical protein [Kiritimatiellia bacterium]